VKLWNDLDEDLKKLPWNKTGERQPRAPRQIGEHATKVYFLIAINEGIASELLARNRRKISVLMARVACMHDTVPEDGRNKFVQFR
jgi:hypothetical protein